MAHALLIFIQVGCTNFQQVCLVVPSRDDYDEVLHPISVFFLLNLQGHPIRLLDLPSLEFCFYFCFEVVDSVHQVLIRISG